MTPSSRILFLTLCGVIPTVLGCCREKPGAPFTNTSRAERKSAITVGQADPQEVERTVQIVGTLMAQYKVTLANELPGTVTK